MMNIQYTMLPLNLAKTRYFLGLINLFKKNVPNINFWIGGVLSRRCPHTLHTCCPVHTLYIFTVFFSLGTLYISSYINQNIKKRLKNLSSAVGFLLFWCWFALPLYLPGLSLSLWRKVPDQVWVQCDSCLKWRRLPDGFDCSRLPEKWFCNMNHDPQFRWHS